LELTAFFKFLSSDYGTASIVYMFPFTEEFSLVILKFSKVVSKLWFFTSFNLAASGTGYFWLSPLMSAV